MTHLWAYIGVCSSVYHATILMPGDGRRSATWGTSTLPESTASQLICRPYVDAELVMFCCDAWYSNKVGRQYSSGLRILRRLIELFGCFTPPSICAPVQRPFVCAARNCTRAYAKL